MSTGHDLSAFVRSPETSKERAGCALARDLFMTPDWEARKKISAEFLDEDPANPALWRLDPSFSDWTVDIIDKETGNMTPYHVHRTALALGSRKSEYFVGLFRNNGLVEALVDNVTRLELESKKVAEAFPLLLDYLYTGKLSYDPDYLVALFCLADYLLIESLQKDLRTRLLVQTRSGTNLAIYYKDAVSLGHKAALDTIAERAGEIAKTFGIAWLTSFLQAMDPQFFLRIKEHGANPSHLKDMLYRFLSIRREEMDPNVFCKLVNHVFISHSVDIDIEDTAELLGLAMNAPGMKGRYPVELQKLLVLGVNRARTCSQYSVHTRLKKVLGALDLAQIIPDLDDDIQSLLQDAFVTFVTENPSVVEEVSEAELSCLHKFLPSEEYLKLSTIMLQQCKTRNQQGSREQKFESCEEVLRGQQVLQEEGGRRFVPEIVSSPKTMTAKRKASEISECNEDDSRALWRLDPNFSDWTIEVTDVESCTLMAYQVHRATLALGLYKSDYFVGLFRSKNLKEVTEKVTRLELDSKVAKAFPLVLDYLYTGNLGQDPKSLVSLFWLADYLLIEPLQGALRYRLREWKTDCKNLVIYYKDAVSLGHEEALNHIARSVENITYDNTFNLNFLCPLLQVVDTAFFSRFGARGNSSGLKEILFKFLFIHREELDPDTFCKLVNNVFSSQSVQVDVEDTEKLLELAFDVPRMEGYPLELQRLLVLGLQNARKLPYLSTSERLNLFMKALDLAQKILDLDSEIQSTLQGMFMTFFTENSSVAEKVSEAELGCLHEFLSSEDYVKLLSTVRSKQCAARREKIRHQEEEFQEKMKSRRTGIFFKNVFVGGENLLWEQDIDPE